MSDYTFLYYDPATGGYSDSPSSAPFRSHPPKPIPEPILELTPINDAMMKYFETHEVPVAPKKYKCRTPFCYGVCKCNKKAINTPCPSARVVNQPQFVNNTDYNAINNYDPSF